MKAPGRKLFLPPAWLLSPRSDSVMLIGSVLVSFAFYALWQARLISPLTLVLVWVFCFHGPHFWGTMSRTYADRSEWPARRRLFLGSALWFAVGPAMVGAGLVIDLGTGRNDLAVLFFFLAALWAYQHVLKQHFGFVALYRARAGELDRRELLFHKYYLLVSMWMPAVMVLATSPGWAPANPLVIWHAELFGPASTLNAITLVSEACVVVFWVAQGVFAVHLLRRIVSGRGINLQATLIALSCVSLHWVVVRSALAPLTDAAEHTTSLGDPGVGIQPYYYAFVPLVTIYHNIQYHGLIWHYNRTKYRGPDARRNYGWAAVLNRNLALYLACGLVYTFLTIGVEHLGFDYGALLSPTGVTVFAAAIWGWAFVHYWVDSKIWHVRGDAELRRVLGFE